MKKIFLAFLILIFLSNFSYAKEEIIKISLLKSVEICPGEKGEFSLVVENKSPLQIRGSLILIAPSFINIEQVKREINLFPKKKDEELFRIRISPKSPLGENQIKVILEQKREKIVEEKIKIFIIEPISMEIEPDLSFKGDKLYLNKIVVNIKNNLQRQTIRGKLKILIFPGNVERIASNYLSLFPNNVSKIEFSQNMFLDQMQKYKIVLIFTTSTGDFLSKEFYLNCYYAKNAKVSPKIDGNLSDDVWKDAICLSLGKFNEDKISTYGEDSSGGKVYFLWDKEYLYLGAEVKDDDLCTNYSEKNDELSFYVFREGKLYQFSFIPGKNMYALLNNSFFESKVESKIIFSGTLNDPSDSDEGYTVEAKIPWKETLSETPEQGRGIFFNLVKIDLKSNLKNDFYFFSWAKGINYNTRGNYTFFGSLVLVK